MNPGNLRKLLTKKFSTIERIYLAEEDKFMTKQRQKTGGSHKVRYTEGWVEFSKKKDAKLCAEMLNNEIIGGKKRHNPMRDDIWNIRYLSKFKWDNLTEKL